MIRFECSVLENGLQNFGRLRTFKEFYENLKPGESVNFYFTGNKDSNGVSWCPDCVVAEPHVKAALEKYEADSDMKFVVINVGERAFWKDMKNPFRLDNNCKISVIPTLVRWKGPQKLEGEQLTKPELLEMFFEE
uniref:Thioredoxin domain-containing protein 17 n=1 Tax=Megaselia scalaris TaxID=36166 RepID=T1GFC3_MEGSC